MPPPATGRREPNLLRQPVHPDITEALIRTLVFAFYDRIARDPSLGPLFQDVIGNDWDPHLEKMCDFWSSVMRMSGRYKGKPMIAHLRIKAIRMEHFDTWLRLFRQTACDICEPYIAELFIDRAERIAESLQLGIFYNPAAELRMAHASLRKDTRS